MTFISLVGLKFKKYHFCREISDLKQGATTFQNTPTKIAYFVIRFFNNFSFTCRQILVRLQTQLDTLYNPKRKVNKENGDEKMLSIAFQLIGLSSKGH